MRTKPFSEGQIETGKVKCIQYTGMVIKALYFYEQCKCLPDSSNQPIVLCNKFTYAINLPQIIVQYND